MTMTTFAKTHTRFNTNTQTITLASRYDRFIKSLEFSYFGLISMAILIGSCLGGVATMKIFENDAPFWQFVLSLGISMANLVACISQAPTKWVVNLFAASLLVNAVLLLLNLI
jgi:hypothetical protein